MPQVPVAIVSGAATVAEVAGDIVGSGYFQRIKLDIGASGASLPFVGGVADPESSLSFVLASGASLNVAASVAGHVAVSARGHVLVSADGNVNVIGGPVVVSGAVSVAGNVAVSVGGSVLVSAVGHVLTSVDGNVAASVAGHVLVSVDGTLLTTPVFASAGATAQGGGYLVMGVDGASAAHYFLTDTAGRQVSVVSGGNIVASVAGNVAASVAGNVAVSVGGHALVSGDGTFLISGITSVQGNVAVSAGGHVLVSGDGTFTVTGIVSVQGTHLVSAAGHVLVSADGTIDVSAHGLVSAGGHVLVSGDGSFIVLGNVASDAADAGAPVKIGGIVAVSSNPASAAAADRVNALFDKIGRQIVVNSHVRELTIQTVATVESAVQKTLFASGGSTLFQDLTCLDVTNAAATAVTLYIFDGSAAAASLIYNLAAGGGFIKNYTPPWKQAVADRTWTVTISPSVSSFIFINAQAVQNI